MDFYSFRKKYANKKKEPDAIYFFNYNEYSIEKTPDGILLEMEVKDENGENKTIHVYFGRSWNTDEMKRFINNILLFFIVSEYDNETLAKIFGARREGKMRFRENELY